MAYATIGELESRWRPLSEDEAARASVLLDDAAVYLSALMGNRNGDGCCRSEALGIVSCSMVQRVMSADTDVFGVSQTSMTAGPYSQSFSFSNPSGDFYLTGFEKQLLGLGGSVIGTIRPKVGWVDD